MKVIWKYPMSPARQEVRLEVPAGGQLLSFQLQHDEPQLWILVDPDMHLEMRVFKYYRTGQPIEDAHKLAFIDTIQMGEESYVLHLFEVNGVNARYVAPLSTRMEYAR